MKMRHCVPEEDEAESHWTLAWQKEQPAPLSFLLTLLSSFTFWKSTGKISWNYNLPPFSIQFPIFLFDALSHFSLFQSCDVELRSGWTHPRILHPFQNCPLTPHQKMATQKNSSHWGLWALIMAWIQCHTLDAALSNTTQYILSA